MMSAFFRFQHTLNRLFNVFKVILILDEFFLKYEGEGGAQTDPPPQKKLPSKSPALLGLIFLRFRKPLFWRIAPWTQDANWAYIRRPVNVLDTTWLLWF